MELTRPVLVVIKPDPNANHKGLIYANMCSIIVYAPRIPPRPLGRLEAPIAQRLGGAAMGWPRMAPRHPQPNPRDPKMAPGGPKMAPKGLKMAPGRPKGAPRWLQH